MQEGLGCCFGCQLALGGQLQQVLSRRLEAFRVRAVSKVMPMRVFLERTMERPIHLPVRPGGVSIHTVTPIIGSTSHTQAMPDIRLLVVRQFGVLIVTPGLSIQRRVQLNEAIMGSPARRDLRVQTRCPGSNRPRHPLM